MINNHLLTVLVPMPPEELGVAIPHKYMLIDTSIFFDDPEDRDLKTRSLEPVSLVNLSWLRRYFHLLRDVKPIFKKTGITEEETNAMHVENNRAVLKFV